MRNQDYFDTDWQRERGRMDRESRFQSGREGEYGRNPDYPRDSPPWQTGTNDYEWSPRYNDYGQNQRYGQSGYRNDYNAGREDYGYGRRQTEYYGGDRPQYSRLRCRDIMTTDVTTTTPGTNLYDVAVMMRDDDVGAIPVLEDGKLKGIVTDRDIVVRGLAEKGRSVENLTVRDVMSDDVYSVRPHDRLVDAIRKMGDKQVRRILVVDNGDKLRGIISMADVALEANQDTELASALEDISEHKSWFGKLFSW
jgi:CBS domain-containing protein